MVLLMAMVISMFRGLEGISLLKTEDLFIINIHNYFLFFNERSVIHLRNVGSHLKLMCVRT